MTQYLREHFSRAERGWTRAELKALLRAEPRFRTRIERARSGHSNAIRTLLERGEIVELGGLLYRK